MFDPFSFTIGLMLGAGAVGIVWHFAAHSPKPRNATKD